MGLLRKCVVCCGCAHLFRVLNGVFYGCLFTLFHHFVYVFLLYFRRTAHFYVLFINTKLGKKCRCSQFLLVRQQVFSVRSTHSFAAIYNFTLVDRKNRELEREDKAGNHQLSQKVSTFFDVAFALRAIKSNEMTYSWCK